MARDLIKFVGNSVTVYVDATTIKEQFTNTVKVVKIPSNRSTPETTKIINLNKVERRFTINGYLSNGKYDSETHTTAIDKKNALTTMFGLGEVVAMTWEGTANDVAIDKYEISYFAMDDKDNVQDDVAIYAFIISCVTGADLI